MAAVVVVSAGAAPCFALGVGVSVWVLGYVQLAICVAVIALCVAVILAFYAVQQACGLCLWRFKCALAFCKRPGICATRCRAG